MLEVFSYITTARPSCWTTHSPHPAGAEAADLQLDRHQSRTGYHWEHGDEQDSHSTHATYRLSEPGTLNTHPGPMLVHDSWLATTNACRRCAGSLLYAFGDDGGQRVDDDERRPSGGAAATKLADLSAGRLLAARVVRERWPDRGNQGRRHRESCAQCMSVRGISSNATHRLE